MLREGQFTLDKCIKMCKATELAELQLKTLNDDSKVETVGFRKNRKPNERGLSKYNTPSTSKVYSGSQNKITRPCGRCGK